LLSMPMAKLSLGILKHTKRLVGLVSRLWAKDYQKLSFRTIYDKPMNKE